MLKKHRLSFFCFSPPVMIATFIIELSLVIYTLLTKKITRPILFGVILILLLAIFQFAEYGVCESFGVTGLSASKIGFVAITFLPPLGLSLIMSITKKYHKFLLTLSYILAVMWSYLFVFNKIITGSVCKPNYVIFNISNPFEGYYYMYYDLLLLLAVGMSLYYARRAKNNTRRALYSIAFGYSAFIIPSMFFAMLDDYVGVDSPLPSVMCGFAVLLALSLVFGVFPLTAKSKS